jgi:hypothetical protein
MNKETRDAIAKVWKTRSDAILESIKSEAQSIQPFEVVDSRDHRFEVLLPDVGGLTDALKRLDDLNYMMSQCCNDNCNPIT